MMAMIQAFVVLVFTLQATRSVLSFTTHIPPSRGGGRMALTSLYRQQASTTRLYASTEYTRAEILEMEELILSLCKEPTDEARRSRLTQVFEEALAKPNGAPKHFSNLFDQVLIVVGDRVKAEATEKALQRQQEEQEASAASEEEEEVVVDLDNDITGNNQEERQLWALIDMMVQSKTIVKKANGELGSESTFG